MVLYPIFFSGEITRNTLRLLRVLNLTEREVRQENVTGYKTQNKKRLQVFEEPKDASDLVAQEGYYFLKTLFLHFIKKRDSGMYQYWEKRQEN